MIVRHCLPGDAEHEVRIYNAAAAQLPGFVPSTNEEVRRGMTGRGFDPGGRFYAEDNGQVVAYTVVEPSGRIHYPWCLPGHERMGHQVIASVMRTLAERKVTRVYATCRADWPNQIEFFEDHDFHHVRDMVNFTQSIGDLPTMFQRSGLDVSVLRPGDISAIEELSPGLLRLRGKTLADYLLNNHNFPTDAVYVYRKDGMPRGVGILIDDAAFARVEDLDPNAPIFRSGAFGTEGLPVKRVNGLFSFLAAPGKDALLIGQNLLWYGTSRMETNTFEMLAAQAPSDAPHLLTFYERYFQKQGKFPVFEREVGSVSQW